METFKMVQNVLFCHKYTMCNALSPLVFPYLKILIPRDSSYHQVVCFSQDFFRSFFFFIQVFNSFLNVFYKGFDFLIFIYKFWISIYELQPKMRAIRIAGFFHRLIQIFINQFFGELIKVNKGLMILKLNFSLDCVFFYNFEMLNSLNLIIFSPIIDENKFDNDQQKYFKQQNAQT
ncbi:unnamed protein product [Paramecium pentaurelia]|uniref:Uncharacterized protein n=1 Tax=Paramecium pentaurelia TaxID=43138 RepID=A0A8S1YH96_9CILI|nr:unnamed protein product [Paramecium pentaurelia]CAD8213420.1 unnamed protein product [Paramecium pentaurelia]